jgi:hypothetical protein
MKKHDQPSPGLEELQLFTNRLTNSHVDSEETTLRRALIAYHLDPSSAAADVIAQTIDIGRNMLPFFLEYKPPEAAELQTLFARLQNAENLVPENEKHIMNAIGVSLNKNIRRED